VLTGRHNPSARLPQTWYSGSAELPAREDYDVIGSGWTYRYSRQAHVYPFGHGLSYATFEYRSPAATVREETPGALTVVADLTLANTSDVPGHEVVQLYARRVAGQNQDPARGAAHPRRLRTDSPRRRREPNVTFEVPQERLEQWSHRSPRSCCPAGNYEFEFSRSSADPAATVRLELS
jgi:beta-glucosidase